MGFPKRGHHQLDEARVSLVEQSVELFAIPSEAQVNRGAKCRRRSFELTKLNVLDPAAIDPGDHRSREFGNPTDILLSQILPQPKRSELAPEPDPIHRAELGPWRLPIDHQAHTRRSPRQYRAAIQHAAHTADSGWYCVVRGSR
jgi:hypothetical protein